MDITGRDCGCLGKCCDPDFRFHLYSYEAVKDFNRRLKYPAKNADRCCNCLVVNIVGMLILAKILSKA